MYTLNILWEIIKMNLYPMRKILTSLMRVSLIKNDLYLGHNKVWMRQKEFHHNCIYDSVYWVNYQLAN